MHPPARCSFAWSSLISLAFACLASRNSLVSCARSLTSSSSREGRLLEQPMLPGFDSNATLFKPLAARFLADVLMSGLTDYLMHMMKSRETAEYPSELDCRDIDLHELVRWPLFLTCPLARSVRQPRARFSLAVSAACAVLKASVVSQLVRQYMQRQLHDPFQQGQRHLHLAKRYSRGSCAERRASCGYQRW